MSAKGRLLPAAFEAASVRYRRILVVRARRGDRPLTTRTAAIRFRQRVEDRQPLRHSARTMQEQHLKATPGAVSVDPDVPDF